MADRPVEPDGGGEAAAQTQAQAIFLRDLVHELSTPLTPLAGYLKLLQGGKLGPLSEAQRRAVETMAVSVGRLVRIAENLGDFAALGAERAPLTLEPVEPDALAAQAIEALGPFIRDARLHVSLAGGGPGPVQADPRKLRQALANLLSNAVKFSPHGGEVLVEVARLPGRLRLAVWDQGPGIPEAAAAGLFEPFHRARSSAAGDLRKHPGSGLGLPVARRIAEAHGGRIWLESPPRAQPPTGDHLFSGCRFVLEIPLTPAPGPAS